LSQQDAGAGTLAPALFDMTDTMRMFLPLFPAEQAAVPPLLFPT